MARKPQVVDNSNLVYYFTNTEFLNETSGWIDDIINGCCYSGYSNPSSPAAMFRALKTLPIISFETVSRFVNVKSEAVDGRVYGERHIFVFLGRLLSAKSGIEFHYERRNGQLFDKLHQSSVVCSGDFCYADGLLLSDLHKSIL